jgi:DNA-binding phage protein
VANKLAPQSDSAEAASELAAFSDPSALGDHLDFAVFLTTARKAREVRGLTVTEVASRMGVDHAAVSRLESGKQPNPTVNTVMRYVEAIGLRVSWGLSQRDDHPVPRGEERTRRRLRSKKDGVL